MGDDLPLNRPINNPLAKLAKLTLLQELCVASPVCTALWCMRSIRINVLEGTEPFAVMVPRQSPLTPHTRCMQRLVRQLVQRIH